MVHRDMRGVSKRLASQGVCRRGCSSRPQAAALTHRGTRSLNYGLTRYREAQWEQVGRSPSLVKPRQPILNLGMLLSTKCNVRINLRSMVRRIFLITLAG